MNKFVVIKWVYVIFFIAGLFGCYNRENKKIKLNNFKNQLGTYQIDISKTEMGSYLNDLHIYKDLEITFKPDSTFYMNISVPFIFDSIGRWEAGGGNLDEWSGLFYKSNPQINTQFDVCCSPDSTFYLNSVTPKIKNPPVNKIFFKRKK